VVFDPPDDGKPIVHKRLLKNLEDVSGFAMHPPFVVGVAEQTLFRKDVRRVLFAGQRFRVLCRVAGDGVGKSWVPLKLQQVISSVSPDLGAQIAKLNRGDLFKSDAGSTNHADASSESTVQSDLHAHAAWIAESANMSRSEDDVARIDAVADARTGAFRTTQDQETHLG